MKEAPAADTVTLSMPVARRVPEVVGDYFALTKPRLNFLVVATSAAGYYLGGPPSADVPLMAQAVTEGLLATAATLSPRHTAKVTSGRACRETDSMLMGRL